MEGNKYEPLNEQEYIDLKSFVDGLGAYLPEDKIQYVWSMFNRLRNETEPQPCTCKSASGHWKRAVDYLTDWTNQRK